MDGRLTMGHARVLAGLKSRDHQVTLREAILRKGLSVRQVEAMAQKAATSAPKKKVSEVDSYIQSLAEGLKRSLGTKVEITRRGRRGHIAIYFYSDEELERLLERLS